MGMDYRYVLLFEREARVEVLERLADMADIDLDRQTLLVLPDRIMALPFEGWIDTGARIPVDDAAPTWEFMTVLCFEPDDEISWYLDRVRHGAGLDGDAEPDGRGRLAVGYIYLTVRNDMGTWADGTDRDLVSFEFGTPGSSMSVLFTESTSIRAAFVGLLERCRGVCGMLDHEDWAELFWWRGRSVSVQLPQAELAMGDIDRFVAEAG